MRKPRSLRSSQARTGFTAWVEDLARDDLALQRAKDALQACIAE